MIEFEPLRPASEFDDANDFYAQYTRQDLPEGEAIRRMKLLRQMLRTDPVLFRSLDKEFCGFHLDAYADKFNALRRRYNTQERPNKFAWHGNVFGNPSFNMAGKATRRAVDSALMSPFFYLAVLIVPASVNSIWWHKFAVRATEIRIPTKRLQHIPPPGIQASTNSRDCAILIYRSNQLNNTSSFKVYPCDPLTGKRI